MRSSLSKPILITCDLLFVAAIILGLFSTDSHITPESSRLYIAAALLCLIACIAGWIIGLTYEARKKKAQDQPHDQNPGNTPHD